MKYAIISVVNGNYSIDSEWTDNIDGARVAFHNRCTALWNAKDVERAVVQLVDRDLNVFTGYKEFIGHEQTEEA